MSHLLLLKEGVFTSLQASPKNTIGELPLGGALDKHAYRLANWLVGNNASKSAVLEITGARVSFMVDCPCQMAFTGARAVISQGNRNFNMYETIHCTSDEPIHIKGIESGFRLYLGIRAQWPDLPLMTQRLHSGDKISLLPHPLLIAPRKAPTTVFDYVDKAYSQPIRVMKGPEYKALPKKAKKALFQSPHIISMQSNRMGYRLESPLPVKQLPEIISSGVLPGTIQATSSGQMIVLMQDAQITGGYARIAQVIRADMDRLAQIPVGQAIRFQKVSIKQAKAAFEALPQWPFA